MTGQDGKWDFERWIQGVGRAISSLLPVERLMGVVGLSRWGQMTVDEIWIPEHAFFF